MQWHKCESDSDAPKNRRLLLIAQPTNTTTDVLAMTTCDVVVGHWDKYRAGFVPVDVPNVPAGVDPVLKVLYWSELPKLPAGISLRQIRSLEV